METIDKSELVEFYKDVDEYSREMDSEIQEEIYSIGLEHLYSSTQKLTGSIVDSSCGSGHLLKRYNDEFKPSHKLIGVDLSELMVMKSRELLQDSAEIYIGDMTKLDMIRSNSCAAMLSYFSLQHLPEQLLLPTFLEWKRTLEIGGQLVIAGWEGSGTINYGDDCDVVAYRYQKELLRSLLLKAGFKVELCIEKQVQSPGEPMNGFYLQATK